MTINVVHRGMELTEAIRAYAEDKLQSLGKFSDIEHIDAELGKTTNHHKSGDVFMCKVCVQIDGDVVRMEREANDLYKAIDKVKDHLRVELADRKERMLARAQGRV